MKSINARTTLKLVLSLSWLIALAVVEAGLRRRVLHIPGPQRQVGSLELRAASGEQRHKEGNTFRSHRSANHRVPAP